MNIQIGNITLEEGRRRVLCLGEDLKLTKTEYKMIHYLMNHPTDTVTREELLKEVWGYKEIIETRATDDTVKRLRKKLNEKGANVCIGTQRGIGFYIEGPEALNGPRDFEEAYKSNCL